MKPTKKRKRAEIEAEQRDQAPIVVSDEGDISEERGGFEAHSKQPVISPVADHGVPARTIAEKRREESDNEENSNAE